MKISRSTDSEMIESTRKYSKRVEVGFQSRSINNLYPPVQYILKQYDSYLILHLTMDDRFPVFGINLLFY